MNQVASLPAMAEGTTSPFAVATAHVRSVATVAHFAHGHAHPPPPLRSLSRATPDLDLVSPGLPAPHDASDNADGASEEEVIARSRRHRKSRKERRAEAEAEAKAREERVARHEAQLEERRRARAELLAEHHRQFHVAPSVAREQQQLAQTSADSRGSPFGPGHPSRSDRRESTASGLPVPWGVPSRGGPRSRSVLSLSGDSDAGPAFSPDLPALHRGARNSESWDETAPRGPRYRLSTIMAMREGGPPAPASSPYVLPPSPTDGPCSRSTSRAGSLGINVFSKRSSDAPIALPPPADPHLPRVLPGHVVQRSAIPRCARSPSDRGVVPDAHQEPSPPVSPPERPPGRPALSVPGVPLDGALGHRRGVAPPVIGEMARLHLSSSDTAAATTTSPVSRLVRSAALPADDESDSDSEAPVVVDGGSPVIFVSPGVDLRTPAKPPGSPLQEQDSLLRSRQGSPCGSWTARGSRREGSACRVGGRIAEARQQDALLSPEGHADGSFRSSHHGSMHGSFNGSVSSRRSASPPARLRSASCAAPRGLRSPVLRGDSSSSSSPRPGCSPRPRSGRSDGSAELAPAIAGSTTDMFGPASTAQVASLVASFHRARRY